ncbi:MAG: hypothetical protein GXP62_10905 [Oligoflexia bacterium]|nr:hypothetical protein [Oligoflexia bacterium]
MQFDEFHCQLILDPKGRLTLPAPLRATLKQSKVSTLVVVANQGKRGGLSFFTPEDYRRVVKGRVRDADPFARKTVNYVRAIDSTSQTVSIDGNGRVRVPLMLRKLAGLERDLRAFSAMDWFEVWNEQRWEEAFDRAMDGWDADTGAGVDFFPAPPSGDAA